MTPQQQDDFWATLQRLAHAYEGHGLTPDERTASLLDQFKQMPPLVQRECLRGLLRIAMHAPGLCTIVKSAVADDEIAGMTTVRRVG